MPVRLAIIRSTGQGEQFQADVCQWNPVTGEIMHASVMDMHELVNEAFAISDVRLLEMNTRMFEAYEFEKHFAPEVWSKVVSILDVLAGRTTPDQVIRLWQAAAEETADLERIRQQHHDNVTQCTCKATDDDPLCQRAAATCVVHGGDAVSTIKVE